MRFKNKQYTQNDSNIDLTPLLDVSFIILIFFILTTTFTDENRLAIEKPKASGEKISQSDVIKIVINKDNILYFQNNLINPKSLKKRLIKELEKRPMSSLVIEADQNSKLSIFVLVVDTAKSVGIENITISTDTNY